jgi:nucleoside-diphosphate-sugar epimerase
MHKPRITLDILVRILADIIILNVSLLLSLLPQAILRHWHPFRLGAMFLPSAILLSIIGPLLFRAMGFYTKGRSYSGKYKALIVFHAATVAFVILAFCLYFLGLQRFFPRSSFLLAWASSSLLLITARLWARLWKHVVLREDRSQVASNEETRPSVLVIGGAGYIGSALLSKLLDEGYRVRLLDCFLFGEDPIKSSIGNPNLEIHRGDFRNVDTVVAAMKGVKSVVHLGAIVGDPACAVDEELTIQINLIATRMIAEVAKGNGISRFVFASSCSVYGASDQVLNERSALNPVSLYARCKIASENVLLSLRDSTFEPVILRFGTVYGLSGRARFDLVVNLLAAKAAVEGVITVYGRDQWRPFLHVHDAASSIIAALNARSESISSTTFNVGADEQNRTLGQIGELIQYMVPGSVLVCSEENGDHRNYRVEFRRIRQELRFEPVWEIERGIQQVLDAIVSGEVTNYQDPKYSNEKSLRTPDSGEHLVAMEDWVTKFLASSSQDGLNIGSRPRICAAELARGQVA